MTKTQFCSKFFILMGLFLTVGQVSPWFGWGSRHGSGYYDRYHRRRHHSYYGNHYYGYPTYHSDDGAGAALMVGGLFGAAIAANASHRDSGSSRTQRKLEKKRDKKIEHLERDLAKHKKRHSSIDDDLFQAKRDDDRKRINSLNNLKSEEQQKINNLRVKINEVQKEYAKRIGNA